jgi:hypothetical protein
MTYRQGWKFCFAAGLIPFSIGWYGYITGFLLSTIAYPDRPFNLLWRTLSMPLSEVGQFNPEVATFIGVATLCFWQLLIVFGTTICTIAYFGIRKAQRWSWYFLLVILVWGAGNDTLATFYLVTHDAMFIPTPLFVDLLGLLGIYFSRDIRHGQVVPGERSSSFATSRFSLEE